MRACGHAGRLRVRHWRPVLRFGSAAAVTHRHDPREMAAGGRGCSRHHDGYAAALWGAHTWRTVTAIVAPLSHAAEAVARRPPLSSAGGRCAGDDQRSGVKRRGWTVGGAEGCLPMALAYCTAVEEPCRCGQRLGRTNEMCSVVARPARARGGQPSNGDCRMAGGSRTRRHGRYRVKA